MKTHITKNREETIGLGADIARRSKAGTFIALIGELGAGKTTFVKGLAKGLGVRNHRHVNSPSFVIIKEYAGKVPLYHFDVYRLNFSSDLEGIGFEEYFYGNGVCVVEWADKIKKLLPKKHIEIKIKIAGENNRRITVK